MSPERSGLDGGRRSLSGAATNVLREAGRRLYLWVATNADRTGLGHSVGRRTRDAGRYWSAPGSEKWQNDSHWRGAGAFETDDDWLAIGREHVVMAKRLAPQVFAVDRKPRVVEWGVGGGANAVAFAPLASEFIGIDIVQASLDEARRQVSAACSTPFRPCLIDIDDPESVMTRVQRRCDLFLCFYVFELLPSEDYGLRLLKIAFDLLEPGGVALVQIKYATKDPLTRSRSLDYRRNLASMTTYPIDEFWLHAERTGFSPSAIALVPENRLDRHYAYFALTRPLVP